MMTAQEGESTTQFVIRVEQARRAVRASATSVYHAFVHKLDDSVRLLLDNIRVNKRANGGGPVTWEDVVAICRDSLAGVSLATTNAALMAAQG